MNYKVLTYTTNEGDFKKTLLYEPKYLIMSNVIQIYRELTTDEYYSMCNRYANKVLCNIGFFVRNNHVLC